MTAAAVDEEGARWQALSAALQRGHLDAARSLLHELPEGPRRLTFLQRRDKQDRTALHLAVAADSAEGLELLLAALPDDGLRQQLLSSAGENGRTALHAAVEAGQGPLVQALLWAAPEPLELLKLQEAAAGATALHMAVDAGNVELARLQLSALPSKLARTELMLVPTTFQETPLHRAAYQGNGAMTRLLLQNVLRERRHELLSMKSGAGTALHMAAQWDSPEVIRALIHAAGGNEDARRDFIRIQNKDEITALQLATRWEKPKAAIALIESLPMTEDWAQAEAKEALEAALNLNWFDMVAEIARAAPEAVSEGFVSNALRKRGMIGTSLVLALAQPLVALEERKTTKSSSKLVEWIPMLIMGSDPRIELIELQQAEDSPLEIKSSHVAELEQSQPAFACSRRAVRCVAHTLPQHLLGSHKVVRALANSPADGALRTPFAQGLVTRWWERRTRWFYCLDIVLNFLHLAVAAWLTHELRVQTFGALKRTLSIALFLVAKDTLDETCQLMNLRKNYFVLSSNWVDFLRVVLEIAALCLIWMASEGDDVTAFSKAVIASWTAMTWFHALTGLRGLRFIGPRLIPILKAVLDVNVMSLAFVLAVAIAGATHAYYVFAVRDSPSFAYAAFIQIFRLGVMGDFDLNELEGQDPTLVDNGNGVFEPRDPQPSNEYVIVHILFLMVSLGISVVLMNLFIGVLSNNYDRFQEVAEELFIRARARLIVEYEVAVLPHLAALLERCMGESCPKRMRTLPPPPLPVPRPPSGSQRHEEEGNGGNEKQEDEKGHSATAADLNVRLVTAWNVPREIVFTRWEGEAEDNHSVRMYVKRSISAQSSLLEERFAALQAETRKSREDSEKRLLERIGGLEDQLHQIRELLLGHGTEARRTF